MINSSKLEGKFRQAIKKHQQSFPVKIYSLAKEFNIQTYEYEFANHASGQIVKKEDNYEITVNKKEPEVRQRFTTAHELAHYFIHREQIGDGIADNGLYRSPLSNSLEVEANQLAADILMPMEEVLKKADEYKTIEELAEYFGVSKTAMMIRLGIPY